MKEEDVQPGEWVILVEDKVVAHNKDAKVIFELMKNYEEGRAIMSKEPSGQYCFY